ncbi:DUF2397 family protein [Nocardiopsis algeriensis]|uniref:Uncharacterized protein n=1 Tax=Nocardiopsis algeriensis TaxID=1478215 RepID=A0A841IQ68_9ACTN|nr:hypothetical protein [Nocardiopsis algeriensis]
MGLNQRAGNPADDGRSGERSAPRHGRAALLRLAAWLEEAGPERADALAGAAYALGPARFLTGRADDETAATRSWWQAEPDRSIVAEPPGTRPPEPVRDHRAQQARLRDAAESSAHWRRAGAAQIRELLSEPTGHRSRLDLSGAGMEVLMELLTAALGSGDASRRPASAGDLEFALRLHIVSAPGAEVTVQGEGGELTLEGLRLYVTPYEQHVLEASVLAPPVPDPPVPEVSAEEAPEDAQGLGEVPATPAGGAPGSVSEGAADGGTPEAPATGPAEEAPEAPEGRETDPGPEPDPEPSAEPAPGPPTGEDTDDTGGADTEPPPDPDTAPTPASGFPFLGGTASYPGAGRRRADEDPGTGGNLRSPDSDDRNTGPLDLGPHRPWNLPRG